MLVYFSAPWCQPCKAIEPKIAQAVEDKGLDVTYVNIEEIDQPALEEWGITGVPQVVVLDDSTEVGRAIGPAILRLL